MHSLFAEGLRDAFISLDESLSLSRAHIEHKLVHSFICIVVHDDIHSLLGNVPEGVLLFRNALNVLLFDHGLNAPLHLLDIRNEVLGDRGDDRTLQLLQTQLKKGKSQ